MTNLLTNEIVFFRNLTKIGTDENKAIYSKTLRGFQTEEIEGTQHDSDITSKINLVDLAGSERQSQAQTSGQRQKVYRTIRIYHDFVQGQRNPPKCQRFAVQDEACQVVDVVNL